MTAQELFLEATKRGLRLEPAGDKLAVIPAKNCPPDFADVLRRNKAELLDWLTHSPRLGWQVVPPDRLPLATVAPRPAPIDREYIVDYLLRQTGGRTGLLAAWLVRRENAYYEGPGEKWDCGLICYAAARDAACWQLNRTEPEVCLLLSGLDKSIGRSK